MTFPVETSQTRVLPFGSDPPLRRRYLLLDEPLRGNLRFGLLLEDLDKLAEETALGYVRRVHPAARVVTAAIDNIYVRHAADIERDLRFHARINFVGRSSLEVGIRVEHSKAPADHIASCYFTMVAREGHGDEARSLTIPPLEFAEPLEIRRAEKARQHRAERQDARNAGAEPPGRDEFDLLARLHAAQDQSGFDGRLASRSVISTWERTYPEHENVPQKIFGGYVVRRAYECAALAAEEVAPDRAVLVAVNRINFLQPVRMGDKLHFQSRVVYSGDHSLAVETNIVRKSRDRSESDLSNTCIFTFVNVGPDLDLRPVPVIHPTTYAEDARFLAAHRRKREHRQWKTTRGEAHPG